MTHSEGLPSNQSEQAEGVYSDFIAYVREHTDYEFSPGEGEASTVYRAQSPVFTPIPVEAIEFSIDKYAELGDDRVWGLYSIGLTAHELHIYSLEIDREYPSEQTHVNLNLGYEDTPYRLEGSGYPSVKGFQESVERLLSTGAFTKVLQRM
jgi:hypothetical protein